MGARLGAGVSSQTTTTWYRCLGRGAEPPCAAAEQFEQASSGGAAEKHTRATGHGTTTTIRPEVGAAWVREET